jgi:hypothetical protein
VSEPDRRDSSAAAGTAKANRRVYVWWGVSLGLLLVLALVCWFVVGPLLRADAVLGEVKQEALASTRNNAGQRHNFVKIAGGGNYMVYKPEVADTILQRLGGPEKSLPILKLYAWLPDRWARHKNMAAHVLGFCGRTAEPTLVTLLDHTELDVRWDAIWALTRLKDVSPAAVPALTRRLDDDEPFIRFEAAILLGRIGPPAEAAGGKLLKLLSAPNGRGGLEIQAAQSLVRIRPEAKDSAAVHEVLLRNLKDVEWNVQLEAAWALGNLGPSAEFAVPALTESLRDAEWNVREASAQALGRVGPSARAAVPALEKARGDEVAQVRTAAAEALKNIRAEEPPK